MPPERDAAVAAVQRRAADMRPTIQTLLASEQDAAARTAAIGALLSERGFALADVTEPDGAHTFVAHTARLDRAAMRKGLRHAHIGVLVDVSDPLAAAASTWLAADIAAIIDAEAEFASLTVVGVASAGDPLAGRRVAESGLVDEVDVLFALEPTTDGDAFPRTIKRTGDALAGGSGRVTVAGGSAARDALQQQLHTIAPVGVTITLAAGGEDAIDITLRAATSMDIWQAQRALHAAVAGADGEGAALDFDPIQDDLIASRLVHRRVKTYGDTAKHKWDRVIGGPPREPHPFGALSYVAPLALVPFNSAIDADGDGLPATMGAITEFTALAALDLMRDMTFRALADDQLVRALRERGLAREHRRWLGVHRVLAPDAEIETRPGGPKLTNFTIINGPQPEHTN